MPIPEEHNVPDRRAQPPVDLNVIAYQVGALQTALDKGLSALERVLEKGLDAVATRLDKIEERQASTELKLERQDARLQALEEYKTELEKRDAAAAAAAASDLKAATTESQHMKTLRMLGGFLVGAAVVGGLILAILAG
jgi:hypothetical protein